MKWTTRQAGSDHRSRLSLPLWKRILFPVFTVILALVVVEGVCWLLLLIAPTPEHTEARFDKEEVSGHAQARFHEPDPELLWRMVPGYSFGNLVVNEDGFRGPRPTTSKSNDGFRIVLLGNSVTFGYKLSEQKSYVGRLRQELGIRGSDDPSNDSHSYEVLNFAVTGYTSWQGRLLYEESIRQHDADLLIAMFGYNDHHSALKSDREKCESKALGLAVRLFRKTGFARFVQRVELGRREGLGREPKPRVCLAEFRDNILKIDEMVREDSSSCVFLTVPLRPSIPLVENFRAIHLDGDGTADTIWTRQIDFIQRRLTEDAREAVRHHIFWGKDLKFFTSYGSHCSTVVELLKTNPDLPLLHYLLAGCYSRRGEHDKALAAMAKCEQLDHERREMEKYNTVLRGLAQESRIEIVDMARIFEQEEDVEDLFLDVVHPSPKGHEIIARTLAEFIHLQRRR